MFQNENCEQGRPLASEGVSPWERHIQEITRRDSADHSQTGHEGGAPRDTRGLRNCRR